MSRSIHLQPGHTCRRMPTPSRHIPGESMFEECERAMKAEQGMNPAWWGLLAVVPFLFFGPEAVIAGLALGVLYAIVVLGAGMIAGIASK